MHILTKYFSLLTEREFNTKSKKASSSSLTKLTSIASFFSKKQYTAITNEFAIKQLKEGRLECSICTIFFSSSSIVLFQIKPYHLYSLLVFILFKRISFLFLNVINIKNIKIFFFLKFYLYICIDLYLNQFMFNQIY